MRRPHRPDLPIVALEGPSGVGKSTLLRSLVRATGRVGLVEAVDRAREPPRLDFRSPGELRRIELRLVESELQRVREAAELTRRGELLLLDTGFVGPLTYSLGLAALLGPRWDVTPDVARGYTEALAMGAWAIPDLTVYLDADPEVVARRVRADPRSHPVERALRHAAVAAYERGIWQGNKKG